MNGGQTLDLCGFQHIFILRVTPGHKLHIKMGILCKYYKAFFSSFLPSSTIIQYHICSHYINDFRKIIKNRIKVSRVTLGHYGHPLGNINIFFCLYVEVNFKSFSFCPGVEQGLVSGVNSHFLTKK